MKVSVKIAIILISLLLAGIAGCRKADPIKLGFVGGLTGRYSDLGTAGRNGALLAVEEANEKGGINGRAIELITRDDKQEPAAAVQADRELIAAGVTAIIGHMTSSMTMAALPIINEQRVLMVSPTSSTDRLTGIDDYFFRVVSTNKQETICLAGHAFQAQGLKKIAALFDLANSGYTESFFNNFKEEFEKLGGTIIFSKGFTLDMDVSFSTLTAEILSTEAEGVLIVAGALDTAMICQQLRKKNFTGKFIPCLWAMTPELISNGGSAVEGLVFFSKQFDQNSTAPDYLLFRDNYRSRFGNEPNFASVHAYDAVRVILEALSIDSNPDNLKRTIIAKRTFTGLQGDFEIDRYGDTQSQFILLTIRDGQFTRID
jgi:branched-chain amino acid transport system substrate-binding protein